MAATPLALTTRYDLPNSTRTPKTRIPAIGFGVWASSSTYESTLTALRVGYRQIDTAQMYKNESDVGRALVDSGIPRSEIFITTKIVEPVGDVDETLESCRESVRRCTGGKRGVWEGGDGYVDLFLVHSPRAGPQARRVVWLALERLKEEGGAREIGVSNYGIKHLSELQTYAKYPPVLNQLELHPFCPQPSLVSYCRSHSLLLQAYAPLIRARKQHDPVLNRIATAHNVSVSQVLMRWSLQKGYIPLPKSDNEERIRQNVDVFGFVLTEEEMGWVDNLGVGLEDGQEAICPYPVHCD